MWSEWRKGSRSNGAGGNCVEMASSADAFRVRDSKNASGPVLRFTGRAMEAFLAGAKRG